LNKLLLFINFFEFDNNYAYVWGFGVLGFWGRYAPHDSPDPVRVRPVLNSLFIAPRVIQGVS